MFENVMRLSAERRKISLPNPLKQKGQKKAATQEHHFFVDGNQQNQILDLYDSIKAGSHVCLSLLNSVVIRNDNFCSIYY
jgi:hypothetical protein